MASSDAPSSLFTIKKDHVTFDGERIMLTNKKGVVVSMIKIKHLPDNRVLIDQRLNCYRGNTPKSEWDDYRGVATILQEYLEQQHSGKQIVSNQSDMSSDAVAFRNRYMATHPDSDWVLD